MFEHPFNGLLLGQVTAMVKDPNGVDPATIIQFDHDFAIEVDVILDGRAAPYLCGQFVIKTFAESIGPGNEKQIGATQTVSLDTVPVLPTPRHYTATINVTAQTLAPGAYRLVTLLTYQNGGTPLEIAGHVEGPIIQIYDV